MNRKILLLDDEAAHRLIARRALRRVDPLFEVTEVESLDEASAALPALHTFSLVILDLNVRGQDSLPLLATMRSLVSLEDLPVVMLSTSALDHEVFAAYRAGANCYLQKADDLKAYQHALARACAFFL